MYYNGVSAMELSSAVFIDSYFSVLEESVLKSLLFDKLLYVVGCTVRCTVRCTTERV